MGFIRAQWSLSLACVMPSHGGYNAARGVLREKQQQQYMGELTRPEKWSAGVREKRRSIKGGSEQKSP